MRNKDFCRLMLEQEKQKRSNGDESTADLYRATRNHFAAFIRERGKSRLLGDVTQDDTMLHDKQAWTRFTLITLVHRSVLSNMPVLLAQSMKESLQKWSVVSRM